MRVARASNVIKTLCASWPLNPHASSALLLSTLRCCCGTASIPGQAQAKTGTHNAAQGEAALAHGLQQEEGS